jgi:hypothetical protein
VGILLEIESIASMFSGYLQTGLYSSMNGTHGLAGWRWLFILDGVISVPIALWGFFGFSLGCQISLTILEPFTGLLRYALLIAWPLLQRILT